MATGKATDFEIYNDYVWSAFSEVLMQNADAFNAQSNGAIRMETVARKGNYDYRSFFKSVSSLVSRRDNTSVSGATDLALTQDDEIGVKLSRKIGPIGNTLDSLAKIGSNTQEFNMVLGQQIAKAVTVDYLNSAMIATQAALSFSGWAVDKSAASPTTMCHAWLAAALAKMGDQANQVVCWVMHSKPYHDLVAASITDKITNVADVTIAAGTAAALGRPVVVSDSSALVSGSDYYTLGLVRDAAIVEESEQRQLVSQIITGYDTLIARVQGEYAFNVKIKGFQWDTGNGGANPTDGDLGTQGYWDKVASDNRSIAGVMLLTH